jgi:type II secretion system protein G
METKHMTLNKPSVKITRQGMTLIELMVVIAIIMILMGIVVGISGAAQRGAAEARARAELGQLSLELENMRADPNFGRFPTNDEGLARLVTWYRDRYPGVQWDLTELNGSTPIDPWGREYDYSIMGGGLFFRLRSGGPSGLSNEYDNISLRDN